MYVIIEPRDKAVELIKKYSSFELLVFNPNIEQTPRFLVNKLNAASAIKCALKEVEGHIQFIEDNEVRGVEQDVEFWIKVEKELSKLRINK